MKGKSHNLLGLWDQFMWHVWRTMAVYCVFMVYYPGYGLLPWLWFITLVMYKSRIYVWTVLSPSSYASIDNGFKTTKNLSLRLQIMMLHGSDFIDADKIHWKKIFFVENIFTEMIQFPETRTFYSVVINQRTWVQFWFCNLHESANNNNNNSLFTLVCYTYVICNNKRN